MTRIFFVVFALALFCIAGYAQNRAQKMPEKTRILFLLDASGSMLEPWGRNQTKLSVARSILTRIVDSLKQDNRIELALRLYGHRSPPEVTNCKDTDLEVPFKVNNHQAIIDKINQLKPKGVTPISYALLQAAGDFPSQAGYRNLVILITDGIESCGGDPCATSAALQKKGVFLQPYIIGLGIPAEKSLECAGRFLNADTPGKFNDVLNDALQRSFSKTTISVYLPGPDQKAHTNINVSFLNSRTGVPVYEFVNYLDPQGRPDTLQVDPLIDYDLVVNTLPPVIKRGVIPDAGRHLSVSIPITAGVLLVRQDGNENRNLVALVKAKGNAALLNNQVVNQPVRYLAGEYEVETLTLPRRKYAVEIRNEKTFNLVIPQSGVVNFNTITTGYGSLYEIMTDGSQEWIMDLDNLKAAFALKLLPGRYKIVFRAKNSPGSKYTAYKTFSVTAGKTHQVNVFQ